jgi:hypothetical protein
VGKNSIIVLVLIVPILSGCQPSPVELSIHANPGDPAIEAVVDHVSREQYQKFHLAVENMGLGLYCGKEYDMGFRNRDYYIYDESVSGDGPTYDEGPTPGNREACSYLQDMYGAMGLSISVQGKYKNVVGELTGTTTPENIYIIGAHYDHVEGDMPGGDDNASGTAGVLEAARVLSQYQFESTIRFVNFNAEEDHLLGSADYVNNHVIPNGENIVGMINLDVILRPGSDAMPDRPIDVEIECNGFSPWVQAYVQAMADYVPSLVLGDIWDYAESSSDNDSFQNAGFPAFLVIENSDGDWSPPSPVANPYYHHFEDATDRLANDPNSDSGVTYDFDFATDIVRACTALLAQEAKLVPRPEQAVVVGSVAMR